jgi:hypothetical protein
VRVRLEPVALVALSLRVAEVRLRLRRRKGERELALHVPPGARAPDALPCVACASTTRSPLLCDDALHVLCEACAPGPRRPPALPRLPRRQGPARMTDIARLAGGHDRTGQPGQEAG